ncbi:hypothetical protein BJV77DRAFT_1068534 [Russula vinacea]|nr:hypothetical protein BJV77DRAFT_1068534 [Russula vinacea]
MGQNSVACLSVLRSSPVLIQVPAPINHHSDITPPTPQDPSPRLSLSHAPVSSCLLFRPTVSDISEDEETANVYDAPTTDLILLEANAAQSAKEDADENSPAVPSSTIAADISGF